jgi:DnaJ-class molecular chaperone
MQSQALLSCYLKALRFFQSHGFKKTEAIALAKAERNLPFIALDTNERIKNAQQTLTCVWCDGSGFIPETGVLCRTCKGSGDSLDTPPNNADCPDCNGHGFVSE